ncbi:MAG: DUF86 domain-containing protein [Coriobacteriia bacterium]|nr:DUF86 domain-containing protein [Coriobacteriia bacterium]
MRRRRTYLPGCATSGRTIPWKRLVGVRDRLAHGYFDVDLDIVTAVLRHDLPALISSLKRALAEP